MNREINTKRILIFCAFAFGIAWATGLVIYLTGGLANSPQIGGGLTLAFVLTATVYMGAPSLAHIFTRLVTREGWHDMHLRTRFVQGWRYWLIGWFAPPLLTFAGLGIYFLLFPGNFDPSLGVLRQMAEKAGQTLPMSPWAILLLQSGGALLIAPILNALPTFGEEFGWRAYLQPKLMPLGERKAYLWMGGIWGVWHWPVIAMGHNYGLNYTGAPWLGMLMMVWFCLLLGTLLGWASQRAGSVWPAVIGHGAINGIAGIGAFLVQGNPSPLLGPMPVGLVGSLGFAAAALAIFWVARQKPVELPVS